MAGALGGAATLIQRHSAGRHRRRAKQRGSGNGEILFRIEFSLHGQNE
jgi:hypothetical protein